MREIKFRVWDKYDNEMKYDAQDTYDYIVNNIMEDCFGDVLKSERYEVMQYTGFKDKNIKEIYEGDIVKLDDDVKKTFNLQDGTIKYVGGCFLVSGNNGDLLSTLFCLVDVYYSLRGEVIGNIYENPELLGE